MKNSNLLTALSTRALAGTTALAAGMALASTALTAAPAQAFGLSIAPQYGSTENTGATAKLDFNFVQQGAQVLLNLDIKNTTNGSAGLGATAATLVGVAFDLPTIVSAYTFSASTYNPGSSGFTKTYTGVSIPGLTQNTFSVGIRSAGSGNFVGGNPQAGLTAGQSSSVSFLLSGANLTAAGVESSFQSGFQGGSLQAAGRFQQVNAGGGSDKVLAGSDAVPEPTTLGGLALGGAILVRLRSRKVQQNA
ncbi:PEP-CTERM sorting domain-containing protein [Kamptonema formosum]|uniref:PEP-CTERM sorting domain-containing protein n=1 Tax=Kamptonema formosum TaxID=331992 RepID=UPI00034AD5D6|nr:PEP-CTERM sorting domain-containing protein [Oscillatoria sp. PCC 10802]